MRKRCDYYRNRYFRSRNYTGWPQKGSHYRLSFYRKRDDLTWWLVWRSGNGVRHINAVTLGRARLVLGLVTSLGRSNIPVFIQATQPGHPSVGRCNKYRSKLVEIVDAD